MKTSTEGGESQHFDRVVSTSGGRDLVAHLEKFLEISTKYEAITGLNKAHR